MPYHKVRQGETLIGLAATNGLKDWQSILERPENAGLKKARPDPGVLLPGDRVFIPPRELKQAAKPVDARHSFKVTLPRAWLRLALKDSAGQPWAGKRYALTVGSQSFTGTLANDGVLEQPVAVDATRGELKVWTAGAEAEPEIWQLAIGSMDPPEEVSGVKARLNNLGFDCGEPDSELTAEASAAIRSFQVLAGLTATGAVDAALSAKLAELYDPATAEQDALTEPEGGGEPGSGAGSVSG